MSGIRTAEERTSQSMDALDRANDIRTGRAKLKKRLREGKVDPFALIGSPGRYGDSLHVAELLVLLPGVGTTKKSRICIAANIEGTDILAAIPEAGREKLADVIRDKCPRIAARWVATDA
jgi:hypothetical protein